MVTHQTIDVMPCLKETYVTDWHLDLGACIQKNFKSMVPPTLSSSQQKQQPGTSAPIPIVEDSFGLMARLFYTPPKPLEQLIKCLGASQIDEDPQMALSAVAKR